MVFKKSEETPCVLIGNKLVSGCGAGCTIAPSVFYHLGRTRAQTCVGIHQHALGLSQDGHKEWSPLKQSQRRGTV